MPIVLSVVVCTYNRIDSLRRCVEALARVSTNVDWELIIVDNGSTDGTGAFLASLPSHFTTAPVLTAVQPKRGLAAARNKGWPLAHGSIVAFTDDDCYVATDYMDAILATFASNPQIGFVGGRVLLYDQSDLRITIQENDKPWLVQPRTFVAAGAIQGANMVFRKEVIARIGGFDEDFGPGTRFNCEDVDAVARASWSGVLGAYDPRPTVYHHHGRKTADEESDLRRSYSKGRGAYYAKFLLRSDSRSAYLKNWRHTVRRELRSAVGTIREGARPTIGRPLREAWGALHYFAAKAIERFR